MTIKIFCVDFESNFNFIHTMFILKKNNILNQYHTYELNPRSHCIYKLTYVLQETSEATTVDAQKTSNLYHNGLTQANHLGEIVE